MVVVAEDACRWSGPQRAGHRLSQVAPPEALPRNPAVDQILAQEDMTKSPSDDDRVLWMLADHLGSVRDIVDHTGAGVSHMTYDAFGNVTGGTGTHLTRYQWTGRERDDATGLQYNRNRWYDPALGRWVSEDPIGFWGGDYNLSRYVENTPTNAIDPSGEVVWFVVVGVGVAWWWFTPDNAHAPGNAQEQAECSLLDRERRQQNAENTVIIIGTTVGGRVGGGLIRSARETAPKEPSQPRVNPNQRKLNGVQQLEDRRGPGQPLEF